MKKYIIGLLCIICNLFADESFDAKVYNQARQQAQILQHIKEKHYRAEHINEAWEAGLNEMLAKLDPHSGYLNQKVYKSMMESTSGEFFGIGIVIDNTRKPKDKHLTIVDVIMGGPAEKAGVEPQDKIIEINGKPLEGMTTEEATSKLKGERNTYVTVKVLRKDKPDLLTFKIKRDVIKEQNSLSFYIKDQNVYYLSLNMFTENAVKQIEQLLKKANGHTYKGLILDLRNNSGGLLSAAVDIAGLFLDKNSEVVSTKNKNNIVTDRYVTKRNPIANSSLPIFILINNYTASAAEILAGVLKNHSEKIARENSTNQKKLMVFLVGTKTFGKGSVQEVIPIGNNAAIKLTTSLYYLPSGITVQGVGITPDFVIERTLPLTEQMQWFTKNYGREQSLSNYIKVGNNENKKDTKKTTEQETEKTKRWEQRAKEMLAKDNQLRSTLTLINLYDTAKSTCPHEVCNREKAIDFIKKHHITNDKLNIEEVKA